VVSIQWSVRALSTLNTGAVGSLNTETKAEVKMANELLAEVTCPNCLHHIKVVAHGERVICPNCRRSFGLRGHLCPKCGGYHVADTAVCTTCGTALSRPCPECGHSNWSGDEQCDNCAAEIDISDVVGVILAEKAQLIEQKRPDVVRQVRAQSAKSSEQQMAKMMEQEKMRQAALREKKAAQAAKDKRLLLMVGTAVVIIFLLFLLLLWWFS
jgi:predicted amidophosphoribosyltransferase